MTTEVRIVALIQAKNEESRLPGWLENVSAAVDGIIALDDGSTDGTADLLQGHPAVLEILTNPPGGTWDERANQNRLVVEARAHSADWVLCLDADERLETRFVENSHSIIDAAEADGISVLCFPLRELWGDPDHYRVDGIWNEKRVCRLFRNVEGHRRMDPRRLHRFWMPLELVADLETNSRLTDFNLYHLAMIDPASRERRLRKFEELDPDNRYQKLGYRYLVDEQGLRLALVGGDRGYAPRH